MDLARARRSTRFCPPLARAIVAIAIFATPCTPAWALLMGGGGNAPIDDPGWSAGCAALVNHPGRVAWWEGPPFGGGQFFAECRGDAADFNAVLVGFARIDVPTKRLVVHSGTGASFWLNPNHKADKRAAAQIDWTFMTWQPASWERLKAMPAEFNPTDPRDVDAGAPAQIDVYVGGQIRWADVVIPEGIEVTDVRPEAHGFAVEDGRVLEGTIVSAATSQPLRGTMRLERVRPKPTGGYNYELVKEAKADAQGRWILKQAPAGRFRVVVSAEGFVARVVGYEQFDDQAGWHFYEGLLSKAGIVDGRVVDEAGQPLAGVRVGVRSITTGGLSRGYESPDEFEALTESHGRFRIENAPIGNGRITLSKSGYCHAGLGPEIAIPARDLELSMQRAATIRVTVTFPTGEFPENYMIRIEPEGGSAVGKWGGSARIDGSGQHVFENVPPGRYELYGAPNPGAVQDRTDAYWVEAIGGTTTDVDVRAR